MCTACDIEDKGRASRLAGMTLAESPYLDCPPMLILWVIGWEQEDSDFREVQLAYTQLSHREAHK